MKTHVLCCAALLLAPTVSGCATGLSLAAAPNVDTTGHFGTEERLSAFAAAGTTSRRLFVSLSGGGGYLDRYGSGFVTVSPEAGVEVGRDVPWSVSGLYSPRIFFRGSEGVAHGLGVAGQVLFRVRRLGGEDGQMLLGPRLSIEAVGKDLSDDQAHEAAGLFQLGLVVRFTVFDTTSKSWMR